MKGEPCETCGGAACVVAGHCRLCELFATGKTPGGHRSECWPQVSVAAGCHPEQVGEATAEATRLGVPTEYTAGGEAVFRDRGHRRAFLKAHKLRDHHAGYGD